MKYAMLYDTLKKTYNSLVGKEVFTSASMDGKVEEFSYPVLAVQEMLDLKSILAGQTEEEIDYKVFLEALQNCGLDTINLLEPFDWVQIRTVFSKIPLNEDSDFLFFSKVFHQVVSYLNPNAIQKIAMERYIQQKVATFDYRPETKHGQEAWKKLGLDRVDTNLYGIFGEKQVDTDHRELKARQCLFLIQGEDCANEFCHAIDEWYVTIETEHPHLRSCMVPVEEIVQRYPNQKEKLFEILSCFSDETEKLYERIKDCIFRGSWLEYGSFPIF